MIKNIKIYTTNCGIKYKNRDDLLLIDFADGASVAGVFTNFRFDSVSFKT